MKNLSLILNLVLLSAVIFLFVDRYSYCCSKSNEPASGNVEMLSPDLENSAGKIAYIDLEAILTGYNYSVELNDKMMKLLESSRNDLRVESERFEADYRKYESKAKSGGFLSQASMENQQADLIQRQQALQEKQAELENNLMNEQSKVESELYRKIVDYLNVVRTEYNFSYILSVVPGSDVLVADSTYNVTNVVLEGLNNQFKEQQSADKK
jgi:outer membrane protein